MHNFNTDKFIETIKTKIGMPISDMISIRNYDIIVSELFYVLNNIDGDVVELGCNIGTTSLIIQSCLNEFKSSKSFHVYDSFAGLPKKNIKDMSVRNKNRFVEGKLKTSAKVLISNFQKKQINLPEIHTGWFADIPDNEYPSKISFAFLDGDFYSSILDSLSKIYYKMTTGGIILIHDYNWPQLPGVTLACHDFLKDKPEQIITDYAKDFIGKIIKI